MCVNSSNHTDVERQNESSNFRPSCLSMVCECLFTFFCVTVFIVGITMFISQQPERHVIDYIVKVYNNSVNVTEE